MSYEHQRWENRVFLYGYVGKLSSFRVEKEGKHAGCSHAGMFLRITEFLARLERTKSQVFWCKGYWDMAEWMKLKVGCAKWAGIEGRLRVYNGRNRVDYIKGEARYYVEILKLYLEDAAGRSDSTMIVSRTEWERLKKIEEAVKTKKLSRFHVPEEKQKTLEVYDVESATDYKGYDDSEDEATPPSPPTKPSRVPESILIPPGAPQPTLVDDPDGVIETKSKRFHGRGKPSG